MSATFAWLGHFAVRIEWSGGALYLDPWMLHEEKNPPAALVLLGNPCAGHSSREDVDLVLPPGGEIAGPPDALAAVGREGMALEAGDVLERPGLLVRALPAANRELSFFPREAGWLGYLITADGRTFFYAGATDRLPEHESVRADVAFVPVSGTWLMGEQEAVELAAASGATTRVALFLAGDRYLRVPGFTTRDGGS